MIKYRQYKSYKGKSVKISSRRVKIKLWMTGFYEVAGKFFEVRSIWGEITRYAIGRFDNKKCHI